MTDAETLKPLLIRLAAGEDLTTADADTAFAALMEGATTPAQIGAFLMGLAAKGETVTEISAGARAMRARVLRVEAPPDAIDTCGTGGDAKGTWNVSTGAAIVAAACGVPVAKHGNRALTSKSGGAQVLEALGVKIDLSPAQITACINEAGIGFMMAPMHHAATKHVAPVRLELGHRTIFNLLGPLANPAGTRRQVLGVFARQWVEPLAHVLKDLGAERAFVVHGSDGIDELTVTGPSEFAELKDGVVTTGEITPEGTGLARHPFEALVGGDPATNAAKLSAMLDGEAGAYRDIVCLNAAAALMVAGRAASLSEGVTLAADAIDGGEAKATLSRLVAVSNRA